MMPTIQNHGVEFRAVLPPPGQTAKPTVSDAPAASKCGRMEPADS
jgi:hypothetical protein